MTFDRDIRFTADQIHATAKAVRLRRQQLQRSIEKAEAAKAAGRKIQHGTHEANIVERNRLALVADNLEVARRQIAQRLSDHILGHMSDDARPVVEVREVH